MSKETKQLKLRLSENQKIAERQPTSVRTGGGEAVDQAVLQHSKGCYETAQYAMSVIKKLEGIIEMQNEELENAANNLCRKDMVLNEESLINFVYQRIKKTLDKTRKLLKE